MHGTRGVVPGALLALRRLGQAEVNCRSESKLHGFGPDVIEMPMQLCRKVYRHFIGLLPAACHSAAQISAQLLDFMGLPFCSGLRSDLATRHHSSVVLAKGPRYRLDEYAFVLRRDLALHQELQRHTQMRLWIVHQLQRSRRGALGLRGGPLLPESLCGLAPLFPL